MTSGEQEAERRIKALKRELVAAHQLVLGREDEVLRLYEELARRDDLLLAERVRRERFETSLPVRLLSQIRDLPVMGWLKAHRTRGYERALARARGATGGQGSRDDARVECPDR